MKIQVDGKQVLELQEWQKNVIKNEIHDDAFQEDMERRVRWILEHKFEMCWERFQKEWLEKLRADPSIQSIPAGKKEFTELVMSHSEYKSRSQRELPKQ